MKIITGIGYDARKPNIPPQLFNTLLCGEHGLIAELEFRAGLQPALESKAKRVVAYLKALQQADDGERFYNESLTVDGIASAERLLEWRDWAMANGWLLHKDSKSTGRLADLEAVEEHFTSKGMSAGERIYALLDNIDLIASAVTSITLHNQLACWPQIYRMLFSRLSNAGVLIDVSPVIVTPQASPESDLGKLQAALFEKSSDELSLKNDGSLRLFSSASKVIASRYAVAQAKQNSLIIASKGHQCLDAAIVAAGANHSGLGDVSTLRAPGQLLSLMLACAWLTPAPESLLQYFTLPTGPHRHLRRQLAKKFKDLPGYNIAQWEEEISAYVEKQKERFPQKDIEKLREDIAKWLPVCASTTDNNMDVSLALRIASTVADYWRARSIAEEKDHVRRIYSGAFSSANAVCEALEEWPASSISKAQLNRLLTIAAEVGQCTYSEARVVSAFDIVDAPEMVTLCDAPLNHLTWLNPSAHLPAVPSAFSQDELACMPYAPSTEELVALQQCALERSYAAILLAKGSVTLINTDSIPGLLKLQLSKLLGEDAWRPLENSILTNQDIGAETTEVKEFQLPLPQRWWRIDQPVPAPRPKESYSSLAALALKPHEYVLRYAAQFREGGIEALSADNRLKGNLAHLIIEAWFNEHAWTGEAITKAEIDKWLNKRLPELVRRYALPLAQPGKMVELQEYHTVVLHAMDRLFKVLSDAAVTHVTPEASYEHYDAIANISGTLDLLCQLNDGRYAIIDMKWAGNKKYSDELMQGRPLQLATYARIANHNLPTKVVDAGYFIISDAELLCNSPRVFPTARIVLPDEHVSLDSIWVDFQNTLAWRLEQLQRGQVEVTYAKSEPDNDSRLPSGGLPVTEIEKVNRKRAGGNNRYGKTTYKPIDTFRNLTGNIKEH